MFDVSKREIFTPNSGLASLRRKLQTNFKVTQNKDVITLTVLREASLVMFVGPRERFSSAEFEAMKEYLNEGGSIFIALGEEGEGAFNTNVNYFCEEFGMAFQDDSVVRTVYYKYLHPKEVHIANGVINREINIAAGMRTRAPQPGASGGAGVPPAISESSPNANLAFAYPYGCSLAVQKPAYPVLSSGPLSFPLNRPVCGLWSAHTPKAGSEGCARGRPAPQKETPKALRLSELCRSSPAAPALPAGCACSARLACFMMIGWTRTRTQSCSMCLRAGSRAAT